MGRNNFYQSFPSTSSAPSGVVLPYAGASAPTSWLLCDGSAVSRTTYASLFAVIGTTFGIGDGSTTFNIPDCRGRTAIGAGTGSGLTPRTLAQNVGAETLPAHTHDMANHTHDGTTDATTPTGSSVPYTGSGSSTPKLDCTSSTAPHNNQTVFNSSHTHTFTSNGPSTNTTGSTGTGSHGVMQPSLVLNYIIKT